MKITKNSCIDFILPLKEEKRTLLRLENAIIVTLINNGAYGARGRFAPYVNHSVPGHSRTKIVKKSKTAACIFGQ